MNIAVLCNGTGSQAALEALHSQGLLAGVATPAATAANGDPNLPLETAAGQAGVPFLRVGGGDPAAQLAPWLQAAGADALCCLGFPRKIPDALLLPDGPGPRLGCFNFHGGPLPGYRGPDPVFWQIRNRERQGSITVHRMTPEIDAGPIAHTADLAVGPEDTYGLWMQRLGAALPRVLIEFVQQLALHGPDLPLRAQDEALARYLPRPTDADRSIDWSWDAAAIDALTRACNPRHGGALTAVQGVPVRLLEVSPAPPLAEGTPPGVIIATDNGLRIACGRGESLRADIIYAVDGFFSGERLARVFGLRPGDRMA